MILSCCAHGHFPVMFARMVSVLVESVRATQVPTTQSGNSFYDQRRRLDCIIADSNGGEQVALHMMDGIGWGEDAGDGLAGVDFVAEADRHFEADAEIE